MASRELTELSINMASGGTGTNLGANGKQKLYKNNAGDVSGGSVNSPVVRTRSLDSGDFNTGGSSFGNLGKSEKTIMETFAARAGLAKEGGIAERKLTEENYADKIAGQLDENSRSYIDASEGRAGFATQTAAVTFLEKSGAKRVMDLERQRDSLLLESKVLEASRLDKLIIEEQDAITTARKTWLENMFATKEDARADNQEVRLDAEEARTQRAFETPQEARDRDLASTVDLGAKQATQELMLTAPDAGILPTDDFATAVSKYKESAVYKRDQKRGDLEIEQLEADIANTRSLTSNRGLDGGGGLGSFGGITLSGDESLDELKEIAVNNVPNLIESKNGKEFYLASLKSADTPEKVRDIMVSTILANSPATFQDTYSLRHEAAGEINEAISIIDGGASTGFLSNSLQAIANTFGFDYDPELAAIKAHIVAATQPYRSDVTGAAWGAQETAEYEALLGTTKYEPTALKDRLRRFRTMLERKNKNAVINAVAPVSQYNIFGEESAGGSEGGGGSDNMFGGDEL